MVRVYLSEVPLWAKGLLLAALLFGSVAVLLAWQRRATTRNRLLLNPPRLRSRKVVQTRMAVLWERVQKQRAA